jgi:hypothetical protein
LTEFRDATSESGRGPGTSEDRADARADVRSERRRWSWC